MRNVLISIFIAACVGVVHGQSVDGQVALPVGLPAMVGPAPADRAITPDSGAEVQATTDNANATIKISGRAPGPGISTWQALASAPLNKGSDATDIVTAQAFPNSFNVTGKYVMYFLPTKTNALDATFVEECEASLKAAAQARGVSKDDIAKINCDSGSFWKYAPERLASFNAKFFDRTKPDVMVGGSGTIGYQQFEFFTNSTAKNKASKTPWGVTAFLGIIPENRPMLVTAGIEYRRKYKESDAGAICPPSSGAPVQCKSGPIGAPQRKDQKLTYLEFRYLFPKQGASLKLGYDAASHHWSGDLPIYLLASPSGALTGGVRASWEQTKKAQLGVFVSSAFSLYPF